MSSLGIDKVISEEKGEQNNMEIVQEDNSEEDKSLNYDI